MFWQGRLPSSSTMRESHWVNNDAVSKSSLQLHFLPSGRLVSKPNSILWQFQEVAELSKATGNTARKATAGMLLSHPFLRTQVQRITFLGPFYILSAKETRLQHHTAGVALRHYDKGLSTMKANVVAWMSDCSGDKFQAEDIPDCIARRRKKRDEEDTAASKEDANKKLIELSKRSNPANKRTKQWNLTPDERELIQSILGDLSNDESWEAAFQLEAGETVFPGEDEGKQKQQDKLLTEIQADTGEGSADAYKTGAGGKVFPKGKHQ